MSAVLDYRKKVMQTLIDELFPLSNVHAVWEGGSPATETMDQFSDIDLCVLADGPQRSLLDVIEKSLLKFGISHTWQAAKSHWGEGLMQRVIVLKDAPKYFFVDAGVFDRAHMPLVKDFLEIERHGQPIIYFDKLGVVTPTHSDADIFFTKQKNRVEEINQAFPIFKTLVQKEIERGHAIDAMAFYQNGMVRPLIEVLGMLYRPYKWDFGMRYVHKHFPKEIQNLIERFNYVKDLNELSKNVIEVERTFNELVIKVRKKTALTEVTPS